jgi:AraC-like DNA-binding protein
MQSVLYIEAKPPSDLSELVHCFWELKTEATLPDDFCFHVLPDACVNILLDQADTRVAAVTALNTTYKVLNLGRAFHYIGVQLLPGVWRGDPNEVVRGLVNTPYQGGLPLVETNKKLVGLDFSAKQLILSELVQWLVGEGLVVVNPVTTKILAHLGDIRTVADMAAIAGVSPRQLQRILRQTTGFSPHDLLKVLRFQQSFRQDYLASYADQSHFVHSFRKVTGYTPSRYSKRFDV